MPLAAFISVWASPKPVSRVLLLPCSDTILKVINQQNTDLCGNPSTERKTTIFLFLLFSDNYNRYRGINRIIQ